MKRSNAISFTFIFFVSISFLNCESPSKSGSASSEATYIKPEAAPSSNTSAEIDIDVATFAEKMQQDEVVILDVRTPGETKDGMINGAFEIDISQGGFKERINQLDREKTYLVYCKSGLRSKKACEIMQEAGFNHVFNLKGGYMAWKKNK